MTDEQSETRDRIIGFAHHIGSPDTPAEDSAKKRGWLDQNGNPTEDGIEMLKSVGDQTGTRSVFRG